MNPPEDDIELRIHQAEVAGKREGRAQGWREALEAALKIPAQDVMTASRMFFVLEIERLLEQGAPKEEGQ